MPSFLCDGGFVGSTAGRCRLTTKVAGLSAAGSEAVEPAVRERALPHLTDLHAAVRQPVLPVLRSGTGAKVVDRACGSRAGSSAPGSGVNCPCPCSALHCTAAGKLLLAHSWMLSERDVELKRFTEATITEKSGLDRQPATARATGTAAGTDEWRPGVTSLAILVRGSATVQPVVVSVVGPTAGFDVRSITPQLRRTAHHVSPSLRGSLRACRQEPLT